MTPRITTQTLTVLSAFISAGRELSGAEIAKQSKLASGTLYPLLARLEQAEWLESHWETGSASELGRPRRRLYRLTGDGEKVAARELSAMAETIGGLTWEPC
jgi:PadR family transcriptional regulator, regulatory protein PadR